MVSVRSFIHIHASRFLWKQHARHPSSTASWKSQALTQRALGSHLQPGERRFRLCVTSREAASPGHFPGFCTSWSLSLPLSQPTGARSLPSLFSSLQSFISSSFPSLPTISPADPPQTQSPAFWGSSSIQHWKVPVCVGSSSFLPG